MAVYECEKVRQRKGLFAEGDYVSTKEMLQRIARHFPNKNILANLDKNGQIVYHTTTQVLQDVENIGNGLLSMGLENKHIAISAENSYEYITCVLSIMGGVGVACPIDKDAPQQLFELLLNKGDVEILLCSRGVLEKAKEAKQNCKKLTQIILIDGEEEGYQTLKEVMRLGSEQETNIYRDKPLDLDAVCQILFTSGTTGANKGVMLTQNNLAGSMTNSLSTLKFRKAPYDSGMSVLPLHHATELDAHTLVRISSAKLTYINDGIKTMTRNMMIFKPHSICVVPMVIKQFYKSIWLTAKKNGKEMALKRKIKLSNFLRKIGIDLSHKLFKDVLKPFGGNLYQIICGGAALNPEVIKGMSDLGIYILNGYGLTECGPLVSANSNACKDVHSIGYACPDVEVKIDEPSENSIGELCIRAKSVSKGYYKDPQATKMAFSEDGFFHSGDYARISKKGKIYLSGRKKNKIVLENGKNVFPEEVERDIENKLDYVKEVVVYAGDVTSNEEIKTVICAGIYIEDISTRKNLNKIKGDFIEINKNLPVYKRVGCVDVLDSEFEKTSSQKLQRESAYSKHNDAIKIII